MADKKAAKSKKKSTVSKKTTVEATAAKTNQYRAFLREYKRFTKSLKQTPIVGAIIAEFIGTFILTIAMLQMQGSPLFVAFAFVGAIMIVGGISGAHLNPAITIGAWVARRINTVFALGYIAAQMIGAAVAWLVLDTFTKSASAEAATSSLFQVGTIAEGKEWYIFLAEMLGVVILSLGVATALRVVKKNKLNAAFTSGLALMTALYAAMSLTTVLLVAQGTTLSFLNPAIAIVANGLNGISNSNLWPIAIFIIAPILGAIVGFLLQNFLHTQTDEAEEACDCEACK